MSFRQARRSAVGTEIVLGEHATALRVGDCLGAGFLGMAVRSHPRQQHQPAQEHERRQHVFVGGGDRSAGAVTRDPGVLPFGQRRVVFDERHRGAEIVEEPTESAIVEVDDRDRGSVDQQVGQPQVGVNQPEPVRSGAIAFQAFAQELFRPVQESVFVGADAVGVLPSAPPSLGAQAVRASPTRTG